MANSAQPPKSLNLRFISRSTLPDIGRGIAAGKPTVTVHGNGQISFSSLTSKTIGTDKATVSFDPKTREMYVVGATDANVKKYKLGEDQIYPLKTSKKGGTYSFAGSRLLNSVEDFGGKDGLYDYRESGNQVFEAQAFEDGNMVVFTLPKGAVAKREVAPRKPRKAKVTADGGTGSGVGSGVSNTANGQNAGSVATEDELLLNV